MLPFGTAGTREGRRLLAGVVLLLVTGVAALNVVVFQNASRRAERDGWQRLEASAELRRDDLVGKLGAFRREALGTLEDPTLQSALLRIAHGDAADLDPAARHELDLARERYGFAGLQLVDAGGRAVFRVSYR